MPCRLLVGQKRRCDLAWNLDVWPEHTARSAYINLVVGRIDRPGNRVMVQLIRPKHIVQTPSHPIHLDVTGVAGWPDGKKKSVLGRSRIDVLIEKFRTRYSGAKPLGHKRRCKHGRWVERIELRPHVSERRWPVRHKV